MVGLLGAMRSGKFEDWGRGLKLMDAGTHPTIGVFGVCYVWFLNLS